MFEAAALANLGRITRNQEFSKSATGAYEFNIITSTVSAPGIHHVIFVLDGNYANWVRHAPYSPYSITGVDNADGYVAVAKPSKHTVQARAFDGSNKMIDEMTVPFYIAA